MVAAHLCSVCSIPGLFIDPSSQTHMFIRKCLQGELEEVGLFSVEFYTLPPRPNSYVEVLTLEYFSPYRLLPEPIGFKMRLLRCTLIYVIGIQMRRGYAGTHGGKMM